MKLSVLFIGLVLGGMQAHASGGTSSSTTGPGVINVKCSGHIGSTQVNQDLQFGGGNLSKQDFATHDGVIYALQLAGYKGFIDILLLQEIRDTNGNVLSSSYIRTHGGTELDLVDSVKNITLICDLGGQP